ncbi:MAG TPA: hypothetical protein VML75_17100 [Kofleriaceae bacterium]|nr:hypothetical protein [Kofleriaceae bacterium]
MTAILVAVVLGGCGNKKAAGLEHGVRLFYEIDPTASPFAPDSAEKSLESAVKILRERFAALDLEQTSVAVRDGRIMVEMPPMSEAQLAPLRATFVQRDRLEFRLVAEMRREVQAWMRAAESDPSAGIDSEVDSWMHYESGQSHQDVYLAAARRDELERYVAIVARTEPLEPGLRIGYEQMPGRDGAAASWRTYVIDTRSGFVPFFTEARVVLDPNSNRPSVSARLDEPGKQAFATLTAANIGHKLAMIRGERVLSAPIIQSAIPGGAVWITMGGSTPDEAQREAVELVTSLRATALPMPLILARIEHF